jgi:type II secretory pathway pseudopilin PulG
VAGKGMDSRKPRDHGFSSVELMIVASLVLITTFIATPSLQGILAAYRGSSAARNIGAQMHLARMRAGSDFTRTLLSLDTVGNTFQLSVYDNDDPACTVATSSCWKLEGGIRSLGTGVSFGYGTISTPPPGLAAVAQSTGVYFNSRGMPVTSGGSPVADYAVYLNNAGRYYAVTVSVTGLVSTFRYVNSTWQPL